MAGKALIKAIFSNWLVIGTCAVLLLLNILFYYFFIRHQEENIARLERQYSLVRKGKVTKGGRRLDTLISRKKEMDTFMAALPQESAFPELVHQVYSMIQRNGLISGRMAFKPEKVGHFSLIRYATSFKVTGRYEQIKHFLADLLDSRSLFCIDGFILEKNGKEKKVSMTLELSLYLK
ncbi:MAG: type 4a pilus biogenesis protein PilO [Deltaproteobacteria bacterium]|nr:type 4a pilus biogenesis protein PilO [Deltaproteobacteria bacterium]MBW2083701.1 type 4a pilus biogenesis protein PilO [Deltaproteobacteria bacterium]HDM09038.1 hypothetical protein [Desulfobacteraceae bacterium]